MDLVVHLLSSDAEVQARAKATPLVIDLAAEDTVGACLERICQEWQLDPESVRLIDYYNQSRISGLDDLGKTLSQAKLYPNQDILIEQKNADGSWPEDTSSEAGATGTMDLFDGIGAASVTRTISPEVTSVTSSDTMLVPVSGYSQVRGIVGLSNLGNTCFMNSMLQCLNSVQDLRFYFSGDRYQADLNRENPLGTKGELATAFADLMDLIWSGNSATVSPRNFKLVLGRCAPQFAGYAQHDAQEVCNYVIDKLHEDVNRVRNKPYVPNFEANGEPDVEVAKEVLSRHRRRNDSYVADLCEGFFKSTVVCPECEKVSVTFDPYMSVSVPLSAADSRTVNVTLRRRDRSLHKLSVQLLRSASVKALSAGVAELVDLPAATLVAVELFAQKVHKVFGLDADAGNIGDGDFIFVYEVEDAALFTRHFSYGGWRTLQSSGSSATHEVDSAPAAAVPAKLAVVVVQREPASPTSYHSNRCVGLPLLLNLDRSISGAALHERLCDELACYQDPGWEAGISAAEPALAAPEALRAPETQDEPVPDEEMPIDNGMPPSYAAAVCAGLDMPTGSQAEGAGEAESMEAATSNGDTMSSALPANPVVAPDQSPWKLFLSSSSYYVSSQSEEAAIAPNHEAAFRNMDESVQTQYLVLEWRPPAFESGQYSREKLEEHKEAASAVRFVVSSAPRLAPQLTLGDCLDLFCKEEKLDADNAWYCPRCKEHREGRKKIQLWSLPSVLVIQLKRFSTQGISRRKLDAMVTFPVEGLDMRPHCLEWVDGTEEETVYDLQAVSNHFGGTSSGHYTAFSKNTKNGLWYSCNDSQTSQVEPSDVVTASAYMLFYVRRGRKQTTPADVQQHELPNGSANAELAGDVVVEPEIASDLT